MAIPNQVVSVKTENLFKRYEVKIKYKVHIFSRSFFGTFFSVFVIATYVAFMVKMVSEYFFFFFFFVNLN